MIWWKLDSDRGALSFFFQKIPKLLPSYCKFFTIKKNKKILKKVLTWFYSRAMMISVEDTTPQHLENFIKRVMALTQLVKMGSRRNRTSVR